MFVSSSTGSVQESLYNHFKEATPIKPPAKFSQKIAVSIAFYFIYYYAPQSWIWGWVRQLRGPSLPHCDDLGLFYITRILLKFVCAPLSVTSFLSGALPSLEEFWILLGTQHTRSSSANFITFFCDSDAYNSNKPRFSRCDVYSGKPLIDIFTLPYVAYLGDGASLKVVPYEAHGNYM